jgi:predicted porin
MKSIAIAASLAALSASAAAQSSVSLYGVVDVGFRHVKNGDASLNAITSNGNNTSRVGLRGIEDLGDGYKASFTLESGLNPDSGSSSDLTRFWNRRSTISLIGGFGEVRIGRDYSVTYLGYEDYDVWSDIGITSVGKFDSSLGTARDTAVRSDNQVLYISPSTWGGFYARAAAAPGEGVAGKKYSAARGGYANGPVDVSVTYGQTTVAPVRGDDKYKTIEGGAAYDFRTVKVSGYYSRSQFAGLRVANAYIGLQVPVGAGIVRASYINSNLSGITSAGVDTNRNDAHQFAIGYLHNMSRRTAVYTNVSFVTNKGASAVAIDKSVTLAPGRNSSGFDLGMRHIF